MFWCLKMINQSYGLTKKCVAKPNMRKDPEYGLNMVYLMCPIVSSIVDQLEITDKERNAGF